MRFIVLTLGFILFVGGAAGSASYLYVLGSGVPECRELATQRDELLSARQQAEAARGTAFANHARERAATLGGMLRRSEYFCNELVFQHRAWAGVYGILALLGGMLVGVGFMLRRRHHYSVGWQG